LPLAPETETQKNKQRNEVDITNDKAALLPDPLSLGDTNVTVEEQFNSMNLSFQDDPDSSTSTLGNMLELPGTSSSSTSQELPFVSSFWYNLKYIRECVYTGRLQGNLTLTFCCSSVHS
jgi:histone-lysine N-methyltransferase NSD1